MEIRQIPLSLVIPSPMNPRKTFEEEALQELADNIEKQGLLQPITVRPVTSGNALFDAEWEDEHYEIVCGERRFRAFSKVDAKCTTGQFAYISAIVREMTDEEAFDAMITENLQRKDVDPIEEAYAFGKLLETGKSAEEIALRFGKSIRFVQDRCKLNNLIPELMKEVREDKCPIAAAMIISKLDEDGQQRYYKEYSKSYQGLTKATAESFVNNLFMTIDKSLWYQSDDQADENFEGGCNRKCSECPLNTANHGCLFYEMKPDGAGKCTNRTNFQSKTLAFMLHEVDRLGDTLVKKGEPLAYGKAVVSLTIDSYEGEETKAIKQRVIDALNERNIEVVDTVRTFSHKNWYSIDDERTLKLLQDGEVYRVYSLFNYTTPSFDEQTWYLKKGNTDEKGSGLPVDVDKILTDFKSKESMLASSMVVESVKALSKAANEKEISTEPLTEVEKKLLMAMIVKSNYNLRKQLKLITVGPVDKDYKAVEDNPNLDLFLRAWMQSALHCGDNAMMSQAEPLLDEIGELWHPEEYRKAKESVTAKFEKQKAKAESQLAKLGYGLDGKPLQK